MDRFRWCMTPESAELSDDETEVLRQGGVSLYNGQNRTDFESGLLSLTSHRLLWQRGSTRMALPLAAVAGASLQQAHHRSTPKVALTLLTPSQLLNAFKVMPARPSWTAAWLVDKGDSRVAMAAGVDFVRLGFTQGGRQTFFTALNETLEAKLWMVAPKYHSSGVGVGGIERSKLAQTVSADRSIGGAFTDLSKLMENAKEMVELSKSLSQRIRSTRAAGGSVTEDETTELRMAMLSMGLQDVDRGEAEEDLVNSRSSEHTSFHHQLAAQVCRVLQPLLQQRTAGVCGGCIDLTTAYCRVNRARGVQLIAPEDLLEAARLMPSMKLPLRLKTFPSGLKVLQLASESDEATLEATCKMVPSGGITAGELARKAGIAPVLAKERLLLCEQRGLLCRDDAEQGLAFYRNLFCTPKEGR